MYDKMIKGMRGGKRDCLIFFNCATITVTLDTLRIEHILQQNNLVLARSPLL